MYFVKTITLYLILLFTYFLASAYAAAPSPPIGLNVVADSYPGRNVNLSWKPPAQEVDYYNVYRSYEPITSRKSDYNIGFVNGGVANYIDLDTIPGETYFYQVTAVNSQGQESAVSVDEITGNATVADRQKPHLGSDFSSQGGVCKFCHFIHRTQSSNKDLKKLTEVQVCYTCHDGTGSDFNVLIDFDQPTSSHNNELQGNVSANIKCLNCHHPHAKPSNPRMTYDLEENLCFLCHKNGGKSGEGVAYPTAPKIKEVFEKKFTHPVKAFSNRHTTSWDENYNNGSGYWTMTPKNRHVECTDCHNQHSASRIGTTAMGPLEGATGVSVDNKKKVGVPTYSFTYSATKQYEVCFKCHSSFNPSWKSAPGQGNKALEFNTNNSSYHPVEGQGKNQSANLNNALIKRGNAYDVSYPLTISSTIKCTNCHNNDDSEGARGPHGSKNQNITRNNGSTLCFNCHNAGKLKAKNWNEGASTNFYDDEGGKGNLHRLHLICKDCHFNTHSNQQAPNTRFKIKANPSNKVIYNDTVPPKNYPTMLVNFSPDLTHSRGKGRPVWEFNKDTKIRRCYVKCHGPKSAQMNGSIYRPNKGDLP